MSFEPDLVVTSPDGGSYDLVVEVKRRAASAASVEQLRRYMIAMRCPTAILVTPDALELFHDTYADFRPSSIASVGTFALPHSLAEAAKRSAIDFEAQVRAWLESLSEGGRESLAPELRAAIEAHVVPVLEEGVLSVAGPRVRRTGTD